MRIEDRAALEQAYLATRYEVPELDLVLIIGQRSSRLDRLLRKWGVTEWAFLSAANPHSQRVSAELNARQHQRLQQAVAARGLSFYGAVGVAMDGIWPAEPSLLIPGLGRNEAISLAREFDQNAIVTGMVADASRLDWCGPE